MESQIAYFHGAAVLIEAKRLWKPAEADGGSTGDAFRVDDLLDFSHEETAGSISEDNATDGLQLSDQSADSSLSVAEKMVGDTATNCAQTPNILDEIEIKTDLCVRCDDIAELEWLSTFVEDSFFGAADFKTGFYSGILNANPKKCTDKSMNKDEFQNSSPFSTMESSATSESLSNHSQDMSVPGRARSKRSRTGVRIWSSRILTPATSSSLESISTNWQPQRGAAAAGSFLSFDGPVLSAETEFITTAELPRVNYPFPAKKPTKLCKRKVWHDVPQPRRCSHCLTQRTPQWRAGPMGPKTLCNACGVRFKSGRLFPEYRPAGSPTFLSHQHSNSHRKVLEMRLQKETSEQQQDIPAQDEVIITQQNKNI